MQLQTHSRYSLHSERRESTVRCFRPPSFVRSVGPTLPDTDPTHGSSFIAGIVDVTPQFGRVCEKSNVRLEGRYIRGVCPTRAW